MLGVPRLAARDVPAITAIVVALPDYFTEDVARQLGRDFAGHDAGVLTDSEETAGFTVAQRKSADAAEILWMAIDRVRRAAGRDRVSGPGAG